MKAFIFKIIQAILYQEAAMFRARYKGHVIAIVGSVGKTSTKDAIGLLVRQAYGDNCFITPKSLNAEEGVPLTILGYGKQPHGFDWLYVMIRGLVVALFGTLPKCMVVEIGEENPGDIAKFSRLVQPTHVIITNISEAHSAYLGSLDAIRKETASVLAFLAPEGTAYVNGDDPYLTRLSLLPTQKKVTVRLHARADYFASGIQVGLEGTSAVLHHANRTQRIQIKRYGEHQIYAVLFVAAVADSLGISTPAQLQTFKSLKPVPGRGVLLPGKKGSYILDESYNAQPAAMVAALETLHAMPGKRKVVVMGDMRELKEPDAIHRQVGKMAREVADYIIAVGPLSKQYAADEWYPNAYDAAGAALRQLGPGVIVLIKGSQNTIRLERVAKALMLHPEHAPQVLARQEPQWLRIP